MPAIYIALGSNLGDRAANLHRALDWLHEFAPIQTTSFLYETPPAYLLDQPKFLNAVCQIQSDLAPYDLLAALKQAEQTLGRVPGVRYGPRVIDLDILFYDDLHLQSPTLDIPHARLAERDFVLQPLCDIDPDLRHPVLGQTVQELWRALDVPPLPKVMPIGSRLWTWGEKTYVMGILNVTPDSFSGDGLLQDGNAVVDRAVAQAQQLVAEGADCLDVGGQSTRPGHTLVSVDEEIARVTPVIRALVETVDVPISVDTFRSEVARAALDAGARMINDVWGLRFAPDLAEVAARAYVPLAVMDNRMQPVDSDYAHIVGAARPVEGDLIQDIRRQLAAALARAQAAGLPRWLQIVDPGYGFGKSLAQNLALIRRLDELAAWGYPLLIGPSRKGSIAKVLGDLPHDELMLGTISACVLAAAHGASLLRVHDVGPVARAVRFADAVMRP